MTRCSSDCYSQAQQATEASVKYTGEARASLMEGAVDLVPHAQNGGYLAVCRCLLEDTCLDSQAFVLVADESSTAGLSSIVPHRKHWGHVVS